MSRTLHPLLARLIARRREQRLTQTAVANHIGISKAGICEMEHGHHEPRFGTLLGYAHIVGFKLLDMAELHTVIAWHRWMPGPRPACSCGWRAEQPGDTHAGHVIARIELDYHRQLRATTDEP